MSARLWLILTLLLALAAAGWWFYPSNGTEKWRYNVGGEVLAPPVVTDDGTIFVATNKITALDPSGKPKWVRDAGGVVRGGLLLTEDSRVLLVESWNSGASVLHAFDTASGNERWRFNVGGGALEGSTAIGSDGTIYVAGTSLHALNPDGSIQWSTSQYSNVRPVVGPNGNIYLATLSGRIIAITPDGAERWIMEAEDGFTVSPTIDDDGTLYAMSQNGHLFAVTSNGQKVWDHRFEDGTFAAPIVGKSVLYVVGEVAQGKGKLYALRSGDGSVLWQRDFSGAVCPPALAADGTLYVGSYDQAMYAFRPDMRRRWAFRATAKFGIPAVAQDGTVFVGTDNGWLYALRSSSGPLARTAWPKYGRDPKNSGRAGQLAAK